jgi:stress-induced morphogen
MRRREDPTDDAFPSHATGGCGQAFTSLIVSPQFQGLNSLKRHRLVNAALKEEIASIHAWTAKCQTPDEWERSKATAAPSLDGTVQGHVEGTTQ